MKIEIIAKPGEIMGQPEKHPNSGKMDSQIFIGKEDPQHASKKKKKKKKASVTKEAKHAPSVEEVWEDWREGRSDDEHFVDEIKSHIHWDWAGISKDPTVRIGIRKALGRLALDDNYARAAKAIGAALSMGQHVIEDMIEDAEEGDYPEVEYSVQARFNLREYKQAKKKKEFDKSPTEKGFFEECVKKHKDKGDPEAYCAAIIDRAKGTTDWRTGPKGEHKE